MNRVTALTAVQHLDELKYHLKFSDGSAGKLDLGQLLPGSLKSQIDPSRAYIGNEGSLAFSDEIEMDPESLRRCLLEMNQHPAPCLHPL